MKNRSITRVSAELVKKSADVFQFAHTRDGVTDAAGLKIGRRQCQQMLEQPCTELDVDPVGGVREKIRAQDTENGFEHRYSKQPNHQDIEGIDAAMDQNLVDDHLEEQRRSEGKQLKEEGCEQHLGQLVTILVNRAEEPCHIETARQLHQVGAPRHQDDAAVPDGFEVLPGHQFRARRFRGLHYDLVVADFAEQEKAAILEHRDRRQRGGRQPRPACLQLARLEAEFPGASDHVRRADRFGPALMPNLGGICSNAMKAQQHDERGKPWIIRLGDFRMCRHVYSTFCDPAATEAPAHSW